MDSFRRADVRAILNDVAEVDNDYRSILQHRGRKHAAQRFFSWRSGRIWCFPGKTVNDATQEGLVEETVLCRPQSSGKLDAKCIHTSSNNLASGENVRRLSRGTGQDVALMGKESLVSSLATVTVRQVPCGIPMIWHMECDRSASIPGSSEHSRRLRRRKQRSCHEFRPLWWSR